jgi:hypothetical protein
MQQHLYGNWAVLEQGGAPNLIISEAIPEAGIAQTVEFAMNSMLEAAQPGAVCVTTAKVLLTPVTASTTEYGAALAFVSCDRGCRRD